MSHGILKKIAKDAGISGAMISMILNAGKRPSWKTAKRLASATPGSTPEDWLEAPPETLRKIISDYAQDKAA